MHGLPYDRASGPYPAQPPIWPDTFPHHAAMAAEGGGDGWDAVRKVWRRKWLVLGITAVAIAAGGVATMAMTPRYTAEARILIGTRDPNVANIPAVLKGLVPNSSTVSSEAYVIGSRKMAHRVGYQLALDESPLFNPALRPPPSWLEKLSPGYLLGELKHEVGGFVDSAKSMLGLGGDDATRNGGGQPPTSAAQQSAQRQQRLWDGIEGKLLSNLDVQPLARSNVLSIQAQSTEPKMASRVANAFAQQYVDQQLAKRREATSEANDWLKKRIADLRGKVQESERAVEQYRQKHDLYATKNDTVIGQQLAALNEELSKSENAVADAQAKLAEAKSQTNAEADSLPAVLQSPLIVQLRAKQAELESRKADLASSYTPKHPKMRNINAQIKDINAKISAEIQRIIGGLKNQLNIAKDQHQRIVARMKKLKAQVGQSNEESVKLRQLEREAQADRDMLQSLLKRSKETSGQGSLLTPNVEILSNAAVPRWPSFPPSKLIMLLAGLIGVGFGVLLALLIEKLDQTFRTSDEIEEYTGLPTLAVVPKVARRGSGRLDHVVRNPHSIYTNAVRMMSTLLSHDRDPRTLAGLVVVTSAVAGEGKSHTSCSLAQVLAAEGRRVALLDFDWRQPTQHQLFGRKRAAGVIELLCGSRSAEDVVHHDNPSGVDVLFAGDVNLMRGRTLPLERLQLLLHTLAQHYDVIVLDTSPTLLTPEVLYLARFADHVVMNVKWGSTTRRAVTTEIKKILRAGGRVSGVVLSQVDLDRYNKYSYADGGYLRHGYLIHDAR